MNVFPRMRQIFCRIRIANSQNWNMPKVIKGPTSTPFATLQKKVFDIIALKWDVWNIEDHYPKQFGVLVFESGINFYLADLIFVEKWHQSQLPFKNAETQI